MKCMLVLLNRPEDVDGRLAELSDIARAHNVTKVYLARVVPPFGTRVRSIAAPHKLDMAARMSDAAAASYLSRVGTALGSGIEVELVGGIGAAEVDRFIVDRHLDLIVTTDSGSGLSRLAGSTGHPMVTSYSVPSRA